MFHYLMAQAEKEQKNCRSRKVAFYGRVSTEHEEQTYALKNQMQWYDELKKQYCDWIVVARYIDDGITGTQAKKRPEFLRMVEDAKKGAFNLIVTREVSRFARNTVDCLQITRELKNYGIEIFFVQEGIWTMDNEGEMILTIMAMVAQEESRKTSERIKAGQEISRQNGVLYGNGNILGYNRVGQTYVVNPEQAKTVQLIFNLYESGLGMQAIRNELMRLGYKNAKGKVEWDSTRISRCLRNSVYKGVMAYNKSHRNNFLDQKIIKNHDEDTYMYMKGDFEAIISTEQWDHCKHIRESRIKVQAVNRNGHLEMKSFGVNKIHNVWTNKLRCKCGSSMRMNKWRKRRDGVIPTGYKCYNQLNKGADKITDTSSDGFCDMRAVCGWKLELMALQIFRKLMKNEMLVKTMGEKLEADKFTESQKADGIRREYEDKIRKLSEKLERLLEMRANGEIDKDTYIAMKLKTEADKQQAQQELLIFDKAACNYNIKSNSKSETITYLKKIISSKTIKVDEKLIEEFVLRINVENEAEFTWYCNFDANGNNGKEPQKLQFVIPYKEALKFRNARNELLRKSQYAELKVIVYY